MDRRTVLKAGGILAALPLTQAKAQTSTGLLEAIDNHRRAYSTWVHSVPDEVNLECAGPEWDALVEAEGGLCAFPCRSLADVAGKASYIVDDETEATRDLFEDLVGNYDRLRLLLHSFCGRGQGYPPGRGRFLPRA